MSMMYIAIILVVCASNQTCLCMHAHIAAVLSHMPCILDDGLQAINCRQCIALH
jgi:hypothetical protein